MIGPLTQCVCVGGGGIRQSSTVQYGESDASNSVVKIIKSGHGQEAFISTTNTPTADAHFNNDTNSTLAMTT